MATILRCWWQNLDLGAIFWILVSDADTKRKWTIVTKMAKTVTNILKLSSTHFVSNIRLQNRCNRHFQSTYERTVHFSRTVHFQPKGWPSPDSLRRSHRFWLNDKANIKWAILSEVALVLIQSKQFCPHKFWMLIYSFFLSFERGKYVWQILLRSYFFSVQYYWLIQNRFQLI